MSGPSRRPDVGQPDNHDPPPERLVGVAAPDPWEDQLRRTLAAQSGRAALARPVPEPDSDLAGVAIARARRVRRRRRAFGLVAVMIVTLAGSGAVVQWLPATERGGPSYTGLFAPTGTDAPTQAPARLATDLAVTTQVATDVIGEGYGGGLVLATTDGRAEHLGPVSAVSSAHRVGEGWVVAGGDGGTARLWWVTPGAAPVALLSGMGAIAVDRERVAWRRGSMLSAAVVSGTGVLHQRVNTRAPDGPGEPVGFLGEAVLLRRAEAGGLPSWDLWTPALGAYTPEWTDAVTRVFGAEPGGHTAVGLAEGAENCLVRLRIGGSLDVIDQACPRGLPAIGVASVSPDGRWLVGTAGAGQDQNPAVLVVDLPAAFAGEATAFGATGRQAASSARPIWLTGEQAVLTGTGGLLRLRPEQVIAGEPDAVELISLAGEPPVLVQGGG